MTGKIGGTMGEGIRGMIRNDTVMFEYDVHDMRRAVDWYRSVLGLEVMFRGGECHTEFALPVPGARLALSLTGRENPIRKAARMFLRTDDLDAVRRRMRDLGEKEGAVEDVDGVVRILWVEDPEGNPFAIEQWMRRR
jgi:predicted enzyme related to lactoylglutathione lyase